MPSRSTPILLFSLALALAPVMPLPAQDGTSTAGHSRARHLAEVGLLPEAADIVVEDIVNYHRHVLRSPVAGEAVAFDLRLGNDLAVPGGSVALQAGFATRRLGDRNDLPPLNIALVIDCSGSMQDEDKLERVKAALRRFVDGLRPSDQVSLVSFAEEAEVRLARTAVGNGSGLQAAIDELGPGGSTNLFGGLRCGYEQLQGPVHEGDMRRVILLTDGMANRGVTDATAIAAESRRFNEEGIDLSTIGLGTDFNRELLQSLARSGRGLFHFVADSKDVTKVFVDEFQSLVGPVARDTRLEIEWDQGVELDLVYGYAPVRETRRLVIPIDDMNFGLTQVVMSRFRVSPRASVGDRLSLRARLSYRTAESDKRVVHKADVTIRVDADDHPLLLDQEVRKNFTIAEMGQAMHEMAALASERRLGDSERTLSRALSLARSRYPSGQDEDLEKVMRMAEGYRSILTARIESVRDY